MVPDRRRPHLRGAIATAALPGRVAIAAWRDELLAACPWLRDAWPAIALFLLSTLLRLPFVSNALVNWDAVQFALASVSFDIAGHQPLRAV